MTVRAAWLTNRGDAAGGQTRNDTRLAPLGTMTPTGETTTLAGVIPGGDPLALEPTGPMTADLGIGRAIVQGAAPQGAYPVAVTEPEPLVFTDGDPSNPRTDLVVLRIYDAAHDDSGQVQAAVEILPGTPAAAPEPPPTPDGALPLYLVTVPEGTSAGTGGIDFTEATTDLRAAVVALGGINPSDTGDGTYRAQYRDNGRGLQRWTGSAWSGIAAEVAPWTRVSLGSGYAHDGNNNGDVEYRVLDLIGTRFIQWRGGMTVRYSAGQPPNEGLFLSSALPTAARPDSLRSVPVTCSYSTSSLVTLKIDHRTSGNVRLFTHGNTPPWISFHGLLYPL